MALPTSRNRTYTAASPIYSGDLNDIQDGIINLYAGYFASVEIPIALFSCGSSAGTVSQTKISHGSGFTVWMPIDAAVGVSIVSATMRLNDLAGAAFASPVLYKMALATRATTSLATATGATGDATWTATPGTPEVVATGYVYFMQAVSGVNGGEFYGGSKTLRKTY